MTPYLSTFRVQRALRRLAALAAGEQLVLEVALCHGAVVTVAYSYTDSKITPARLVEPAGRSDPIFARVTAEQRLPQDWLQEDVKYYLALFAAQRRTDYDRFGPNLILSVSEPAHMLAMKLHACDCSRPPAAKDISDVEFLLQKMGVDSWSVVTALYERFLPGCSLSEDVRSLVIAMFVPSDRCAR
jgi:hypothetical protein